MARCRTADGELPSLLSNIPCEVTCDLYIAQRVDGAFTITGECLKGQPTTRSSRHVDTAPRRDRDHRNGCGVARVGAHAGIAVVQDVSAPIRIRWTDHDAADGLIRMVDEGQC